MSQSCTADQTDSLTHDSAHSVGSTLLRRVLRQRSCTVKFCSVTKNVHARTSYCRVIILFNSNLSVYYLKIILKSLEKPNNQYSICGKTKGGRVSNVFWTKPVRGVNENLEVWRNQTGFNPSFHPHPLTINRALTTTHNHANKGKQAYLRSLNAALSLLKVQYSKSLTVRLKFYTCWLCRYEHVYT